MIINRENKFFFSIKLKGITQVIAINLLHLKNKYFDQCIN